MTVQELSRDQLIVLKQGEIVNLRGCAHWSDLANADSIITDEEIFAAYAGTNFTKEDF